MKKITLLACLVSVGVFAQETESYSSQSQPVVGDSNGAQVAAITNRESQNEQAIISTFVSLDEYNAAVSNDCNDATLTSEDFTGGPGAISVCGEIISNAGGGCFAAGEIEVGFSATSSAIANPESVVFIPPGAIGNTSSLVGATTFAEFTIINFDSDVYTAAFDIWENNDPSTELRFFTPAGALIETITVNTPTNTQTFFGFYASELIGKIEIEGANDSGELFGNFLFGGECSNLSISDKNLSSISIYPNPTKDLVAVNLPTSVANSLSLIDLSGKQILSIKNSNSLDMSDIASGLYLLQITTDEGTITRKIVKQ